MHNFSSNELLNDRLSHGFIATNTTSPIYRFTVYSKKKKLVNQSTEHKQQAYLQRGKCNHDAHYEWGKEEQLALNWRDCQLQLVKQAPHETGEKSLQQWNSEMAKNVTNRTIFKEPWTIFMRKGCAD